MKQFIFLKTLVLRFAIVLLLFSILRVLFYCFNFNSFHVSGFIEGIKILTGGILFDLSALVYVNLALIFFHLIPLPFRHNAKYQIFLKIVFYISNITPIALAICDFEYYSYNNKRITADVLPLLFEGNSLLLDFIVDFWHILILIIGALYFIEFLYRKVNAYCLYKPINLSINHNKLSFWKQALIFIVAIPFIVLLARGSIGTKPLTPIQASRFANVENGPLVTNSVFTFIHSISSRELKYKQYFTDADLNKHFNIRQQYSQHQNQANVVIIVLEGISTEFFGALTDTTTYTPFLDSIINNSLVFENAFANAERSNKGMVAILSSIPTLMDDAFMSSAYQSNCISGTGTFLKKMGYHTSFFHGGNNGTMNFLAYTRAVGIDNYYGRDEFNNDAFFDGAWGIYDEEFLQFFANNLNTFPQPFFSTVFTLASHSPFKIPAKYKDKFPKGKSEVSQSIGYTDFALRNFFNTISKQKWFNNTLFIITADHPYKVDEHIWEKFYTPLQKYSIPLIFYKPNEFKHFRSKVLAQQLDIMPSILDYTGYTGSFNAFGQSVFNTKKQRFVYQYKGGIYQIADTAHFVYFDGDKCLAAFNYMADTSFKNNILLTDTSTKSLVHVNKIKAIIQIYNACLIQNKLCIVK